MLNLIKEINHKVDLIEMVNELSLKEIDYKLLNEINVAIDKMDLVRLNQINEALNEYLF